MSTQSASALPATGTWTIDPHSSARFSVVHHSVATFTASFYGITGAFDADASRLSGSVAVESVHLPKLERLKQHLLTSDWFEAEHHPLISFESTDISEEAGRIELRGDLTMRGISRPIVAHGTVGGLAPVRNFPLETTSDHIGIDLTTVLDRREFELHYNNELPDGRTNLGWDVTLWVALELVEESE